MKTLKLFPFLALLFFVGSCGENAGREAEMDADVITTEEIPDSDEVINNWEQAWNNNDTAGVRQMTADDVVLVLNGNEFPQDSLAAWMQAASSAMKDLKMKSLKKGSTDNIAYDTGTYSHASTTDTTRYGGSYTFIWERSNEENDWKVKVMNISEAQPVSE